MGVLSDLLKERFALKTRSLVNPLVAAVGVAAIPVALNNPDRVGLLMVNLSANTIYVSPLPGVLATAGIRLDANGGFMSMIWDEDFELVSQAWWGIATGAASAILILETIGEKEATPIK